MTRLRHTYFLLLSLLGLVLAAPTRAQEAPRPEWTAETIDLFATLAVQEGGRVKPLDTYAGFQLLRMNAKRQVPAPWEGGKKLGPTEWLMDCIFFPEVARNFKHFYVRDADTLSAVGLEFEGRKRTDRYSYQELLPGRDRLFDLASQYDEIEPKFRDRIQSQVVALAQNVMGFEQLVGGLEFARRRYRVDRSPGLQALFDGAKDVPYSALLAKGTELLRLARGEGAPESVDADMDATRVLFDELVSHGRGSGHGLAIFPPEAPVEEDTEWRTAEDLAFTAVSEPDRAEDSLGALASLERLVEAPGDSDAFRAEAKSLHQSLVTLADRRGEYGKIPLEVSFYRLDFFTRALVFFLLAFVACAISWLGVRRGRILAGLQWTGLSVGTVLLITGIVYRCIIRGRPPVSTLYETILFITAVVMLSAIFAEWINRQRIALSLAPILGAAGMFLAMKYELKEAVTAGDTMPSLVAVLDTNFWLATHVTTVTVGYAAGLLAAGLAHVWLFGRILGLKRSDPGFYRGIARMTYGTQCFGLLFALVGTILGGIWANYSWGRFWGWDPKENGALLIVLWMLALLHGRLGGYLRDFGFAIGSIMGGMVVSFSWWGVNFLGIGLHSYGFTEGVLGMLRTSWYIESAVILLGFAWWLVIGRRELAPGANRQVPAKVATEGT